MKNTLLLLIITNCISLSAQHLIQSELSVIENGSILINPFTGGLNFCQLSNIDLDNDNDGIPDDSDEDGVPDYLDND